MTQATKMTILVTLGLTAAVALGLSLMSEPAEAENMLKIHFDDTFTGSGTWQLKSGSSTKTNYSSFPAVYSYSRPDNEFYQISNKSAYVSCIFINGKDNYKSTPNIPPEVSEVYLRYLDEMCEMSDGPFTEYGESKVNVYAKNINNQGIKLIREFQTDQGTEQADIDTNITNSTSPVVKTYQAAANTTEKFKVDFYGTVKTCKMGDLEEIPTSINSINVVIDAAGQTCKLAPEKAKFNLNIQGAPYAQQHFDVYLGSAQADYAACYGDEPTYYVFNFDKAGLYELEVERNQTIDCAPLIMNINLWFYQEHIMCKDKNGNSASGVIPMHATTVNVKGYYGSNRAETTCTIESFE